MKTVLLGLCLSLVPLAAVAQPEKLDGAFRLTRFGQLISPREAPLLRGPVKQLVERGHDSTDYQTWEFDRASRPLTRARVSLGVKTTTRYKWQNDRLVSQEKAEEYQDHPTIKPRITIDGFDYDDQGRLTKSTWASGNGPAEGKTTYAYRPRPDNGVDVVYTVNSVAGVRGQLFSFDPNGRLMRHQMGADGFLSASDISISWRDCCDGGVLIESTDHGELVAKEYFDRDGLLLASIKVGIKDVYRSEYDYVFDKMGNWTERREYDFSMENGKVVRGALKGKTLRTISYWR